MSRELKYCPHIVCPVPSLSAALSAVAEQIGTDHPDVLPDELREIALVIAEIYMMEPDRMMKISGQWIPARQVQDIYMTLTGEHVEAVQAKFERVHSRIRSAKWYLQTALYNVAFELAHDAANLYAVHNA
ncbi:MAG: hypothetical protein IJK40_04975 [Clostridia bacterium]|nr:hypothetical protein [Clostridia bacterium]